MTIYKVDTNWVREQIGSLEYAAIWDCHYSSDLAAYGQTGRGGELLAVCHAPDFGRQQAEYEGACVPDSPYYNTESEKRREAFARLPEKEWQLVFALCNTSWGSDAHQELGLQNLPVENWQENEHNAILSAPYWRVVGFRSPEHLCGWMGHCYRLGLDPLPTLRRNTHLFCWNVSSQETTLLQEGYSVHPAHIKC